MPEICVLDEDNCLRLDSILRAFHCAIKEEQSWALIYQSVSALKQDLNQNNKNNLFIKSTNLFIKNNGTVHMKSWHSSSNATKSVPIIKVISSIATLIYEALDYGTPNDEEIVLPSLLNQIFDLMTPEVSFDEGIEDIEDINTYRLLDEVIVKCESRIRDNSDISEHYRNVCRALVAEAIEMSTFLNQISIGTQELKKIKNINNKEVDNIQVQVWAHLWMRVMRQLRVGVSLKSIDNKELIDRQRREYELTPFEMLLDDINSQRYSLKKVVLPKEVEKDARTVIMDFIRSRPPLKPASERQLSPLPQIEPTLHQKLMEGIKSPHQLKATEKPFQRKYDSFHIPRGKRYTIGNNKTINQIQTEELSGNVFQRFSFRNLSLRSGSINHFPTVKNNGSVEPIYFMPTPTMPRRMSFWGRICHTLW